jgi:hypothetical protein
MKMRVLVAFSSLAAIILVLLLLFGVRSGGSLNENQERALKRSLRAPLTPATHLELGHNLDTNAIPVLTKALETRPGLVDKAYGWAWSNAPAATRSNLPRPLDSAAADQIRLRASALLGDPKVGNFVAPSTLVKELRDPSWGIRMNALACLNNAALPKSGPEGLREEKGTILTLVLAAAQDPQMEVRMSAVLCLGYFKEAPDQVIPVLSKALTDNFPDVRIRAAMAFYRFDPAQAEKAGALTTAFDCLHSNGTHGSRHLAADFLKKEGKLPPSEEQ